MKIRGQIKKNWSIILIWKIEVNWKNCKVILFLPSYETDNVCYANSNEMNRGKGAQWGHTEHHILKFK